jgi:DNA-binding NtrC family response regulator
VLTVAKSFDEAKNLLDNNNFDVLIADYILPDSRGEHIKYLSGSDFPVIVMTAYGGEKEAVQSKIRCNIIDFTMPNMGGEEVLEEIQKIKPDAMIIISSGYGEQQIQKKFAGKNLAAFIQKAYSIKILKNILRKLLK